jgi:hypothetical protein
MLDNGFRETCLTIQPRWDQEIKIQEALRAGIIRSAEDVIDAGLEHLRERMPELSSSEAPGPSDAQLLTVAERRKCEGRKSLPEIFEPIRGLLSDEEVDRLFARNRSPSRPVDLE